jgi:hypothetical protein
MRLFNYLPILAIVLSACSPDKAPPLAVATVDTWLLLSIDEIPFEAQIAVSAGEQRDGLMHRESLPKDGGMLFPYPAERQVAFWMANTPIPLDIGFFNRNGVLLEIHRMVPYDTNRTVSHSVEVQYALEMSSGWFSSNGLFPGARLDLTKLAEALEQRGVDPSLYGLPATR